MTSINKYEQFLLQTLARPGFAVGRELNRALQEKFRIGSDAARKIIQRAVEGQYINSSKPVSFGNGQYAYFPYDAILDRTMILQVTKMYRPPLYRILTVMDINDGIVSYYEALKLAGAPFDKSITKTDSIEKIIGELEQLELVVIREDAAGIKYFIDINQDDAAQELMSRHRNNMVLDATFIPDVLRFLQHSNLIDNSRLLYRNKANPQIGVKQNNFAWDAVAYTKTTGINPGKASKADTTEKQTLMVLDIVIHRDYSMDDLQGFYARVQSVVSSVKTGVRKILPVVAFAHIDDPRTYNTMRKLGFITIDLQLIFGSKFSTILSNLAAINKEGSTKSKTRTIEETLATVRKTGQEGNLRNLKGDLFEFLMYPLMHQLFPNATIRHGRKLSTKNPDKKEYEYDYIIDSANQNEVIVIELKGYVASARIPLGTTDKKNTVSWFFGKTFPLAKEILKEDHSKPKVTASFITSAGFQTDAEKYLEEINKGKLKPAAIDAWYNREKLLQLLRQKGLTRESGVIEKYYIEEGD